MMNYYDRKNRETWAVIRITVQCTVLAAVVLWMLHACVAAVDKHRDPAGDLSRERRAEIMRWTDYEKVQHLDLADKYLTARVERNWREAR